MSHGTIKKQTDKKDRRLLLWCAAAFGMALAAAMTVAMVKGFFPFGRRSIYYSDLIYEFSVFLTEFWRKVHTGGSLFYSWKTGLGGVFWGDLLDYVSSPFNLLVLLVKEEQINEAVAVLIYLRQALAAAFMCFFLCRRRGGKPSFAGALSGFLYSVCGWFCGYYFIIIYLDAYMLLPLLLLGIERIIDRRRPWLYVAVFTVILLSNFYIAYSVAVFAAVYWVFYYFSRYRFAAPLATEGGAPGNRLLRSRFFMTGAMFAAASVLSVLLLAVFFVPLLLQLFRSEPNADVSSAAGLFGNITQQIAALFSGALSQSNTFQHYPAVYTGVLVFAAAPLFFFLQKTAKREKIAMAALVALLVLSFNLPPLDYVWHGFRFPTNFPFRQAFLFSAVLSIMTCRVLSGIKEVPRKALPVFLGGFAVIGGCGVVELLRREEGGRVISLADLIVTVLLFGLFCGMLALLRTGKKEQVAAATAFLLLFSFGDGVYTFLSNIQLAEVHTDMDAEKEEAEKVLSKIADESLFYRTETVTPQLINDGAFFDYDGVRQSSSMKAAAPLELLNDLGCDSNRSNFAGYEEQTPLFNSIFGIRYLLEPKDYAAYSGLSYLSCAGESYRVAETLGDYSLYRYGYALPLGFAADGALAEWTAEEGAPEVNQSAFYAAAAGSGESALLYCDGAATAAAIADNAKVQDLGDHRYRVEPAEGEADTSYGLSLKFTAEISGQVYAAIEATEGAFTNMTFWVVNEEAGERPAFTSVSNSICRAVYNAKKGESLTLGVNPTAGEACTLRVRVFQIDPAVLARQHEAIEKNGLLALTDFSDTHFEGTVDAARDSVLCVTVPCDPGWTVSVDGVVLTDGDYDKIGGALYGIPLEKGSHTVAFDYALPGLAAGAALSACAAAVIAVFAVLSRRRRPAAPTEEADQEDAS